MQHQPSPEPELLDNPRAVRVRAVAKLLRGAARRKEGRFVVEGPQAVREALAHGAAVDEVWLGEDADARHPELRRLAVEAGIVVRPASAEVLAAVSEAQTPQGVVAVAPLPGASLAALDDRARLVVVLDEVRDPGNLGTVIRSADAAGADAVIVTAASVDHTNPKAVRASAGSIFHLPIVVGVDLDEALAELRARGFAVFAAAAGESSRDVHRMAAAELAGRTAWLLGNEARGLDPETIARADAAVRIPLYGAAESLNVAVAGSILVYESARAQRLAG